MTPPHLSWSAVTLLLACMSIASVLLVPAPAPGAVIARAPSAVPGTGAGEHGASSLESAAARAGNTGRAVAMSLIGLAFAIAATVLAFRRDFKEAAGVFAVGIVSVLLATPAGISLLRDTVASLFGSR
jgi:tellurite resistance protein TehA-like permease